MPIGGPVNLTGSPAAATGLQGFYVEIDEANNVAEINENNNGALVGGVLGSPVNPTPSSGTTYLPLLRR